MAWGYVIYENEGEEVRIVVQSSKKSNKILHHVNKKFNIQYWFSVRFKKKGSFFVFIIC